MRGRIRDGLHLRGRQARDEGVISRISMTVSVALRFSAFLFFFALWKDNKCLEIGNLAIKFE